MRQAMFAEDVAAQPGLLQRLDPRVKVVTLLGLLLVAALVRSVVVLLVVYVVTLGARRGRRALPLGVLRQAGLALRPDLHRHRRAPRHAQRRHARRRSSCRSAPGSATRSGSPARDCTARRSSSSGWPSSISLVVLLTLTTPWTRLLAALRALFVPRMFVLVLGMAYRYLFHLLDSVTDMYTARKARTVDADVGVATGRRVRGRLRRRPVRQGARAVRRGAPGDDRPGYDRQRADADGLPHRGRATSSWSLGCVAVGIAVLGVDRALG